MLRDNVLLMIKCWSNNVKIGVILMKKSYVSVLISVVKLELAAQNILKMMMDTG